MNTSLSRLIVAAMLLAGTTGVLGQGTITFNGAALFSGTDYYELGMWFHTVIPQGEVSHDGMAGSPAITSPSNVPYNSTPYMVFFRQNSPDDFVALSLTNGSSFGLTSVQLADPTSPSLSPVAITFEGFRADGSVVTNTFTTPGNGATTFQNYQFGSAFASGLASVKIDAPRWAMDNLAFDVPEPGSLALLGLGLVGLILRKRQGRAPCVNVIPPPLICRATLGP